MYIDPGTSFSDMKRELAWTLRDMPGELDGMTDANAIVRFEVFQRLFLERNC